MCEASAYILKNGQEEMFLESIDRIESSHDRIKLVSIFGEEKRVKAKVKTISLIDHKILLEPID
ncbi:MAG: CooT family nickel-binding protein [Deltaproteobacteria bacterium]|nr:CooT family nickel-binding protein [Deltaproteobacteria bacterium]MBW1913351.1 CooT family nickel-binding protein [Deltaproteobacteria bacterium]